MSLDTKREEIRKLEEKAQMKEEALKKSEQMLEEDAIRFDTFLKENDKKAHDAITRAEREALRGGDAVIDDDAVAALAVGARRRPVEAVRAAPPRPR